LKPHSGRSETLDLYSWQSRRIESLFTEERSQWSMTCDQHSQSQSQGAQQETKSQHSKRQHSDHHVCWGILILFNARQDANTNSPITSSPSGNSMESKLAAEMHHDRSLWESGYLYASKLSQ
jgi:hypothetical protein